MFRGALVRPLALSAITLAALAACSSSGSRNTDVTIGTGKSSRGEPSTALTASSTLYIPTGDRTGSGLMIEKKTPSEVAPGKEFEYHIVATNMTSASLENVVITDTMGANLKLVSAEPKQDMNGSIARWALGTLPPKASQTIKVHAMATGGSQVGSCSSGSYQLALCSNISIVQPPLRVGMTAPPTALMCDPISMKISVTNPSTTPAKGVRIRDSLGGLATADGKTALDIDVGTLAGGQTKDFSFTLKPGKTGSYTHKAVVTAEGNVNIESPPSTIVVHQPALTLNCRGPSQVFVGRTASFEFTVKNTGDGPCNAVVTMPMAHGAQFVSATEGGNIVGSNCVWTVPNLAAGASKTVAVTIKPTMATVSVNATATTPCATPASTTCGTNMIGIPGLLLEGTDNPDPIEVGQTTVYTLTVTNQGSADLTGIDLFCTMDEGDIMEFVGATGAKPTVNGKTITFPTIQKLAPGTKQAFTVTIRAKSAGQASFRAETKSVEITRPLIKIETTNFYK